MAEFTKGEWKLHGIVIFAEDGGVICELSEPRASKYIEHQPLGYGSKDRAEAMANGRLIVASKRLLEALEHSTTALLYISAELKELGEHEDAAMMERQAEENRAAIEAAREG